MLPTSANGASPTWSARASRRSMSERPDTVTIAAIGDLHVTESSEHRYRDLFAEIAEKADVLALCGDLTTFGQTKESAILAEELPASPSPLVPAPGNPDYDSAQPHKAAHN